MKFLSVTGFIFVLLGVAVCSTDVNPESGDKKTEKRGIYGGFGYGGYGGHGFYGGYGHGYGHGHGHGYGYPTSYVNFHVPSYHHGHGYDGFSHGFGGYGGYPHFH